MSRILKKHNQKVTASYSVASIETCSHGHIDQGAFTLEGKANSSRYKSSHKKRLQIFQPQQRDADRRTRSKEESNTRGHVHCWNYLVLTALWRKTNVSDVQASLKREDEVISSL